MNQTTTTNEAAIFCSYILGKNITPQAQDLYVAAIGRTSAPDDNVVRFARNHPWSVGFLDAGSALVNPHCELRRRLYTMFAILETQPEFAADFLPQQRPAWHIVTIGLVGVRSVFRAVVGIILVKVVA